MFLVQLDILSWAAIFFLKNMAAFEVMRTRDMAAFEVTRTRDTAAFEVMRTRDMAAFEVMRTRDMAAFEVMRTRPREGIKRTGEPCPRWACMLFYMKCKLCEVHQLPDSRTVENYSHGHGHGSTVMVTGHLFRRPRHSCHSHTYVAGPDIYVTVTVDL